MKIIRHRSRANSGVARILEVVVAATIIFIVFSASSILISNSHATATQEKSDLDTIGYNVLSRLTESGTIEATIESNPQQLIQLKAFVQSSLPSSMFFKLTITDRTHPSNIISPITNTDLSVFSNLNTVSSTPIIYTSKSGAIYHLVLVLANAGGN
jgi:hypothetical protein